MLNHVAAAPRPPARVVVLGARGFIGAALCRRLARENIPVLALGSSEIDLTAASAGATLAGTLQPGDAVVFAACLTPDRGRDLGTTMRNLAMGHQVADALAKSAAEYVLYLSSDAVYGDGVSRISDETPAAPSSAYGVMHLARELMLTSTLKAPVGVLRTTLVYGAGDPHNSYGPNRFRRMAAKDGQIALGGGGEEMRDHLLVDDVAELLRRMLLHRSQGMAFAATGHSASFAEVAALVAAQFSPPSRIVNLPRQSPVTHRHFDVTQTLIAFPDIAFTPLEKGIAQTHRELTETR